MRIDPESPEPDVVDRAVVAVREGGVVLYPADTIYGLGCDALNGEAIRRLVDAKGRSEEKGLLVLVPSLAEVYPLVEAVPELALRLLDQCWPGPLTVLLRPSARLPELLTGSEGKIGIRCPRGPFLQTWLTQLGRPLVSTSANRSGDPYCGDVARLRELFDGKVDLFMECGELPRRPPSTVVDLTTSLFQVVRKGAQGIQIVNMLKGLR
jgi:L-threonylcarbamoyladenylate synthase